MGRTASAYRQARRTDWLTNYKAMSWMEYNHTPPTIRLPFILKPSRYMPHIGAKQRAKGATK